MLVHDPSCFLCKTPVVPSNLRQRRVLPSDCAISTISPSEKRYVPIWQLSPAFSPDRAAPRQAADKQPTINPKDNEQILKRCILVFDAIGHCFGFKVSFSAVALSRLRVFFLVICHSERSREW